MIMTDNVEVELWGGGDRLTVTARLRKRKGKGEGEGAGCAHGR